MAKEDQVKLWRKLVYAVGSIPYSMCNTVIGFYLSIFLLEVAIVSLCVCVFRWLYPHYADTSVIVLLIFNI